MKNISNMILERINNYEAKTIFTNSDFYDLGSKETVKKTLLRLNDRGVITRLIPGFYTVPYYSKIIKEYSYPGPDELAKKIACKYNWHITAFGETALNNIGLSTQVNGSYIYLSDGPYREYGYQNVTIKFKHTNNRSISNFSKELSLVIQSIQAIGKEGITDYELNIMKQYCHKYVKENIKEDCKHIPFWIYEVLLKISEAK